MKDPIERLRRAVWLYRQPLTHRPRQAGDAVSDLFVWRRSRDWETSFELIDVASLFDPEPGRPANTCTLCLFDSQGRVVGRHSYELESGRRRTIDIGTLLPVDAGEFGTFSVFHSQTPEAVTALGSFIAERGYVSYRYRQAPLRSYVHGNLDAISLGKGSGFQLLGAGSLLRREYRMQHVLVGAGCYELAVVNPSARAQGFVVRARAADDGRLVQSHDARLPPGGSHVFPVRLEDGQDAKVVLESRLVMARPLVFSLHGQAMDVFHG